MARPDRLASLAARRHILREYERARAKGISQREFAEATGISSPRYLRKIISGERTGKIIEKRAAEGGVVTVTVKDSFGTERSMNVRLVAGTSRFDIFREKVQRRLRGITQRQSAGWQERYAARIGRLRIIRLRKPKLVGKAAVAVIAV